MKRRVTAADLYEKKYTGKITRYEQEAKRQEAIKSGNIKMLQRVFLVGM